MLCLRDITSYDDVVLCTSCVDSVHRLVRLQQKSAISVKSLFVYQSPLREVHCLQEAASVVTYVCRRDP